MVTFSFFLTSACAGQLSGFITAKPSRACKTWEVDIQRQCSLVSLMTFVIGHLNRLPWDPKLEMQGDKPFPGGTLKLIVENEACLFAGFSGSYFIVWEWSWGEAFSDSLYNVCAQKHFFFLTPESCRPLWACKISHISSWSKYATTSEIRRRGTKEVTETGGVLGDLWLCPHWARQLYFVNALWVTNSAFALEIKVEFFRACRKGTQLF